MESITLMTIIDREILSNVSKISIKREYPGDIIRLQSILGKEEHMSFEEAYRKYWSRMYAYFLYKLGGDTYQAEDLTSDLFYLAFKKWDELGTFEEPRLVVWLYNAALILARQFWRKSRGAPPIDSISSDLHFQHSCDIADPDDRFWEQLQTEDEKYQDYLDRLKQMLTELELQVFVCRIEKEMSVLETAAELRMSPDNVMVRTYRIRQKLRPIIAALFREDK